jgi:hypothetical protein
MMLDLTFDDSMESTKCKTLLNARHLYFFIHFSFQLFLLGFGSIDKSLFCAEASCVVVMAFVCEAKLDVPAYRQPQMRERKTLEAFYVFPLDNRVK